jgi:hypothetical protein
MNLFRDNYHVEFLLLDRRSGIECAQFILRSAEEEENYCDRTDCVIPAINLLEFYFERKWSFALG